MRRIILLTAAITGLAGLVLVGHGLWIHAKALLAQILLERAFAQTLATGKPIKPWAWADTWPVARVEVPRLKRSSIVLAGTSGQSLAFGPGHVERTPEVGERGTTIYAARRETHFSFLGELAAGDEIRVRRRDGAVFHYVVTASAVVSWDASVIDPARAGRHLALATCWPLDGTAPGPLRYVVHAELSDSPPALESARAHAAIR